MKINFEEVKKTAQQDSIKNKTKSIQDFDSFLKKEIQQKEKQIGPINISPLEVEFSNLEAALRLQENQPVKQRPEKIMEKIKSSLNMWEKYSHELKENNLKTSFKTLENILSEMSDLEKEMNLKTISSNEQISSIINELKIMAIAEKARLLRGEYL
jgi:hypothetical protein